MAHRRWIGGDASNPGKWDVAANWLEGSVPTDGDVVTLPAGAPAIDDGLDQSSVKLDGFVVEEGFTSNIGLDTEDLAITLKVDEFLYAGTGTAYISVAVYSISDVSPLVRRCGPGATGVHGLELTGPAFKTVHFQGTGRLGVGTKPGDTTTRLDEINVTGAGTAEIGPDVVDVAGTGSPDVTVTHATAEVTAQCTVDNLEALAGIYRQAGDGWTTAHIHEATVYASGSGTHGTTQVDPRGKLYNNDNLEPRTFTSVTIEDGGTWIDSSGKGTYTNAVEFPTGMGRCTLDFGRDKKLTVASI